MIKKIKLIILICGVLCKSVIAQTDNNQIEFTAIYGLKVYTPDGYSIKGRISGGELAYRFNMANNSADYIRMLRITDIDIVASYRNLQSLIINNNLASKGSLGGAYSIIGRVEVPLIKAGPVKLLLTPGFGLVYSTVSYFTNGNPLVGSHINFASQAGMNVITAVNSSTGIRAGIDLFHYSNSGVREPNNGINSLNVTLGIIKNINQSGPATTTQPFKYDYQNSFEFGFDAGWRGVFESKSKLYRSGFYAGYSYRLNQVFSIKAGFDAGYYFTVYNPANHNYTFENYGTSYDKWREGISIGGDLRLGRLAIMASYGYYLHFNSYYPVKTYLSPGLKYYLLPWLALQSKTYVHNSKVDYLGYGLLFSAF
jgi:Lipid A 3-O-deacylase (PagL)